MSFVALGGDAGVRPTFFELVAAEKLMPSLKAAVLYSLSVYAQRRPALHHLLDREDELFFLLSMALDRQALAANGGSFAEGLYGLRRAPASGSSGGSSRQPLTDSQRSMSLILLVRRQAGPLGRSGAAGCTAWLPIPCRLVRGSTSQLRLTCRL